jgi:hypothetical protein
MAGRERKRLTGFNVSTDMPFAGGHPLKGAKTIKSQDLSSL